MSESFRAKALPFASLTMAAAFFGGTWVAARGIEADVPPATLAFVRWVVAACVLVPIFLPRVLRHWGTVRAEWRVLAVAAALGMAGFTAMIFKGLTTTTAINGALINASTPVYIILLSLVGIGEKSLPRQILGAAVALAGLIVVITRGEPERLLGLEFTPGDLWVLAAMFFWALYNIILRTWPTRLPAFVFVTVTVVLAMLMLAPVSAWELLSGESFTLTNRAIGGILYLGLGASIMAYICWNFGLRSIGAGPASLFQYLIPVFAAVFAILILDEALHLFHFAGAALIVAGIALANAPVRRKEQIHDA